MTAEVSPTLRAFIAVELPDDVKRGLARLQEPLWATGARVKWVAPENFHITLQFLGETPNARLDTIQDRIEGVCRSREPFPVELARLGAFPNVYRPKTVWVGMETGADALSDLAGELARRLDEERSGKKERFQPHVTLGHARDAKGAPELRDLLLAPGSAPPLRFIAESVTLFHSDLRREGPIYTPLARFPFSPAG